MCGLIGPDSQNRANSRLRLGLLGCNNGMRSPLRRSSRGCSRKRSGGSRCRALHPSWPALNALLRGLDLLYETWLTRRILHVFLTCHADPGDGGIPSINFSSASKYAKTNLLTFGTTAIASGPNVKPSFFLRSTESENKSMYVRGATPTKDLRWTRPATLS